MAKPLLLDGLVEPVVEERDERIDLRRVEDENRSLRREVEDLKQNNERLTRSVENLRSSLAPLHRALRTIFGEIELAVGEEPTGGAAGSPAASSESADPRWVSFKNSFPGRGAEIIDALMVHGEMRISHLATLLKCDPRTIGQWTAKLRAAGAINQTQGLITLRKGA